MNPVIGFVSRYRWPLILLTLFLVSLAVASFRGRQAEAQKVELREARVAVRTAEARADLNKQAEVITDRRSTHETKTRETAKEATDVLQTVAPSDLLPEYLRALRELRDEADRNAPPGAGRSEPPREVPAA
jgi:hypothetical protein